MMLLHVCCADCGLKMTDAISRDPSMKNEEIHLYFYNPNIHPQSEFTARQVALQKIAAEKNLKLIIANWTPGDYFNAQSALDDQQRFNKALRCPNCIRLRLTRTFEFAAQNGYTSVSSSFQTSNYVPNGVLLEIGRELSERTGLLFYEPQEIDCDLKTKGFYKQNYCGCAYSLLERMGEKYGADRRR
jgi:epoxyqueuosine reductase